MKWTLTLLIALSWNAYGSEIPLRQVLDHSIFPDKGSRLGLRVLHYGELLAEGVPARCEMEGQDGYGYRLLRTGEQTVQVQSIVKGQVEEKASEGKVEPYGSPLASYIQVRTRTGDWGMSMEFILSDRLDSSIGAYRGAVMFTEINWVKPAEGGEEKEDLHPMMKKVVICHPEE